MFVLKKFGMKKVGKLFVHGPIATWNGVLRSLFDWLGVANDWAKKNSVKSH